MPDLNSLLASVDAAHDEIVALLQDLVRIPTVNRGSRPDTGNETPACDLLRPKLEPAGIAVRGARVGAGPRQPDRPHRPDRRQAPAVHVAHRRGARRGRDPVGAPAVFGHDRPRPGLRPRRRRRQGRRRRPLHGAGPAPARRRAARRRAGVPGGRRRGVGRRWGAGWVAEHYRRQGPRRRRHQRGRRLAHPQPAGPAVPGVPGREGPTRGAHHPPGSLRPRLACRGAPTTRSRCWPKPSSASPPTSPRSTSRTRSFARCWRRWASSRRRRPRTSTASPTACAGPGGAGDRCSRRPRG